MSESKVDKKIISWALYDWANSSFSTTIMAGFFPIFFKEFWSQGIDSTLTTARLGTTISLASLALALISPTLGILADQRNIKKLMTFTFMMMGIIGCAALAWIEAGLWQWAAIFYAMATLGFNGSSVFYDSLLPSVAPGKKADSASSLGFGLGYLGGGVLFTLNVMMYLKPDWFGLRDQIQAVQFSFLSVALWWFLFSIPLFLNVPEPKDPSVSVTKFHLFHSTLVALKSLWKTVRGLVKQKSIFIFLLAFWLYIDGVYTVMTMAVDFGISIGLKSSDLIAALLLVQFVGFPATIFFGKMAGVWGCKKPILICLTAYAFGVVGATYMSEAWHFYLLAGMIGLVQGGVQALSRSLFSRMIPANSSGEYFGLFNLVGKFASIIGPVLVGWGAFFTGDPRKGMLGLLVLFFLGGLLLSKVKEPEPSGAA